MCGLQRRYGEPCERVVTPGRPGRRRGSGRTCEVRTLTDLSELQDARRRVRRRLAVAERIDPDPVEPAAGRWSMPAATRRPPTATASRSGAALAFVGRHASGGRVAHAPALAHGRGAPSPPRPARRLGAEDAPAGVGPRAGDRHDRVDVRPARAAQRRSSTWSSSASTSRASRSTSTARWTTRSTPAIRPTGCSPGGAWTSPKAVAASMGGLDRLDPIELIVGGRDVIEIELPDDIVAIRRAEPGRGGAVADRGARGAAGGLRRRVPDHRRQRRRRLRPGEAQMTIEAFRLHRLSIPLVTALPHQLRHRVGARRDPRRGGLRGRRPRLGRVRDDVVAGLQLRVRQWRRRRHHRPPAADAARGGGRGRPRGRAGGHGGRPRPSRWPRRALSTAMLDVWLRERGLSLASYLGAVRDRVDCGVSVGIPATESIDELLDEVGGYVDAGYRRIKLKIEPGWDIEPVARRPRAVAGHAAADRREPGLHAVPTRPTSPGSTSSTCCCTSSRCRRRTGTGTS